MTPENDTATLPRPVRILVLACFLVSGASGLAYEIIWVRQLTLIAGATIPAISTVLAVFMGGLALGARTFGQLADRTKNLLKLYAGLEAGIGVYGLLQPVLLTAAGTGYVALARHANLQGLALTTVRLTAAAFVLLLPCVLMGGTLPVLARFVSRSHVRFGFDLGTLYAINLVGAVVGSVVTSFVLVRALGLRGTIVAAVLGNLLAGLTAFLVAVRAGGSVLRPPGSERGSVREPLPPVLRGVCLGLAGLSGFCTMGYQVTWSRMLSFGFDNTVYAFSVILSTFLLGLALGGFVFARMDGRVQRLRLLLAAHVLGGITALVLAPVAARHLAVLHPLSIRFGPTGGLQLASMGLVAAAVMLLPTTFMGVVFPLVSRLLVNDLGQVGQQLGRAYWINTAGAILGSVVTGFVLIPAWSIKGCLLALAIGQIAGGLLLVRWLGITRWKMAGVALLCCLAFLTARWGFEQMLPGVSPFDPLGPEYARAKLVAHRDDVTASVSVFEFPRNERVLRINGFPAATDNVSAAYMPMMTHLPMLLHSRPRRVLVICFGTGATAGAALLHPGAYVDAVDINRSVFVFAPWFERVNRAVFRDPRARLIMNDGRNYLLTTRETYDVVTSEPMPPTHAGMVNLYSREYYELVRRRLAPGGLMAQWLPFHLVNGSEALDILSTVHAVFPETTLWVHSMTGIVVARADGPARISWPRWQQGWSEAALGADLVRLGLPEPAALTRVFVASSDGVARLARGGRVVTDDLPTLEFHPLRHRLRAQTGPYTDESARVLAQIFSLGTNERLPLDGAPPDQFDRLQLHVVAQGLIRQGDLAMAVGLPTEAVRFYESGLHLGKEMRPLFLNRMAMAERAAGHQESARRLLRESLAAEPDNQQTRALLREFESDDRTSGS